MTLVTSLLGFVLYNATSENNNGFVWDWGLQFDWVGYWAYFILPIHKIDFMGEPKAAALFIDVLFRILIGYGIYQFISAFRRHGKQG